MEKLNTEDILKGKKEISPTFCVYPWMEFILRSISSITLCCLSETKIKDENGKAYTYEDISMKDYWNGYGLRQIRRKMLAGEKIKACEQCYYLEDMGQTSYRQAYNKQWFESESGTEILDRVEKSRTNGYKVEKPPLYLDIRPGNLCNLKCRMCTPGDSSKIYQEQKQLLKDNPSEIRSLVNYVNDYFEGDKKLSNWHKNETIWNQIYEWGPNLKQLYFTGGEPTLIKEIWKLIDYLIENDCSKNISLMFNTNCTQAPDKLINTFFFFSKVNINFSIDGYKEVQEYIRYPSKWIEVENNIIKMLRNRKHNTLFHFSVVIQVYNILNLPQLLTWIDRLQKKYGKIRTSLLICRRPEFFDISTLPFNIKQLALSRIEKYKSAYKGSDEFLLECLGVITNILKDKEKSGIENYLKNFYKYTTLLDKKRGNNFKKIFPELNNLFEEDGRWKN